MANSVVLNPVASTVIQNVQKLVPSTSFVMLKTKELAAHESSTTRVMRKVLYASHISSIVIRNKAAQVGPTFTFTFIAKPITRSFVINMPEAYGKYWYECFESCIASGMFNDAGAAGNDAIAHGHLLSEISITKSAHNCWIWSISKEPPLTSNPIRIGGYMYGG